MSAVHHDERWLSLQWLEKTGPQPGKQRASFAPQAMPDQVRTILGAINQTAVIEFGAQLHMRVPSQQQQVVAHLLTKVDALQREISEMRRDQARVVVIREVSEADARKLVLNYYRTHQGEELYPSDVASALRLDAETVFSITNDLVREGALE